MPELNHEHYMRRAIALTAHVPHLPFGAVIVNQEDEAILAEGWNKSDQNPTWHGEIDAINQLVLAQGRTGLILYNAAEPCPMCQGAILWSGIGTVVFGTSIQFLQQHGWWQIDLSARELVSRSPRKKCTVPEGVLEQECNALFLGARTSK